MAHSLERIPNTPCITFLLRCYEDPSYFPYPNVLKFLSKQFSPLPRTFTALLFLMSCFFDSMRDSATFEVLFYLMILWIYTCRALAF